MKRSRVLPVVFSDEEMARLDALRASYRSLSGAKVSKADVIRYGLSLIPSQVPLFAFRPVSKA